MCEAGSRVSKYGNEEYIQSEQTSLLDINQAFVSQEMKGRIRANAQPRGIAEDRFGARVKNY